MPHTRPMIDETYRTIIQQLEQNIRPRIPNSPELMAELKVAMQKERPPRNQTLCVLCHLATPDSSFTKNLISHLNTDYPMETQVFILEAVQKHILDARMISGDRLTPEFLKAFNDYLSLAPKKVLYFIIGIIEGCGAQSIFFRQGLKNLKWGVLDAFKKEYRETITRIDALENRWQKMLK